MFLTTESMEFTELGFWTIFYEQTFGKWSKFPPLWEGDSAGKAVVLGWDPLRWDEIRQLEIAPPREFFLWLCFARIPGGNFSVGRALRKV